mgnify:CR=1 FL=1
MSHYCNVELELRDIDALVLALLDMGFVRTEIEVHSEAQPLYGFQGDLRPEKAHVIIRRQHVGDSSNDLGFVKDPVTGRLTAIISDFDQTHVIGRHGGTYGQAWVDSLSKAYAVRDSIKLGMRDGYGRVIKQESRADGSIYLRLGRG